jgi:hypothetical protein
VWGADARRIFFHGGSTLEAEAWNILGILSVKDLAVSKRALLEPTESLYVCAATGHLFTGYATRGSNGELKGKFTVDYDSETNRPQRVDRFPPGDFSATCRYVATTSSFHGPVPWGIFEVATGQELFHFDFTAEGRKDEFEFHSWNPRQDQLFLRVSYPASRGKAGEDRTRLELVDLRRRRVLESFASSSDGVDWPDEVAWSNDGMWLIIARGNSLVFHPTPKVE